MKQHEYVALSGLSKSRVSRLVKAGMPLTSKAEADSWRRSKTIPKVTVDRPARPPEAAESIDKTQLEADGPEAAYERAKLMERECYDLAMRAIRAGDPDAGRQAKTYSEVSKALRDAKADLIAALRAEGTLIELDTARKFLDDTLGAAAALAKSMPKQLASRIAPHDPDSAEVELERWVTETFLKTMRATL